MPRYKALIEYCGANYLGWQRQPNTNKTIQGILEEALLKFSREKVTVIGSSRTDRGVHARGQVAHFDLHKVYQETNIIKGVNFYLQGSLVSILNLEKVPDDFHSRALATKRHYKYLIINRIAPLTLDIGKALWVKKTLDVSKMQEGANYLIGINDFASFRSSQCTSLSTYKNLSQLDIYQTGHEIEKRIHINISANSFLHHMVRNIVGTLLLVGFEKIKPSAVKQIMEAKSRNNAGPTANACGLYLMLVDYT